MSTNPNRMQRSRSYVGPVVLIVIGLGVLLSNLTGDRFGGSFIPLAIGLVFLVAYAATRKYGFLVPGGILTGVGAGVLAESLYGVTQSGTFVVIGGGIGFLAIYVLDLIVSGDGARWWPVVPGALMVLIGTTMLSGNQELTRQLGLWSPALLVLLGVWILVRRSRPAGN